MRSIVAMILAGCSLVGVLVNQPNGRKGAERVVTILSTAQFVMEACVYNALNCRETELPINKNYVGELTALWYTRKAKNEMYDNAASMNQTPQMILYENECFPEELVSSMEKLVCQPLEREFNKAWSTNKDYTFEDTSYAIEMNRFGAEDIKLSVEEIRDFYPQLLKKCDGMDLENCNIYDVYQAIGGDYCEGIFCYKDGSGEDMFVLVMDSGGSFGIREIYQARLREDGSFEIFNDFQTKNAGYGRVIRYGDSYYYVFVEYNYNLKIYDRIRLHRLGEAPREECLVIKYVPESYLWRNIFDVYEGNELEEYIKSIQDEIVSERYLDIGMDRDIAVYNGDEDNDEEEMCAIDFTNTGVLIYMDKSSFIPSNDSFAWSLRCDFYVYDESGENLSELEKAKVDVTVQEPRLVQMWFKQIGDKVYSFFLYHVEDYNYILQTALIEGVDIKLIRSDVLVPQRHFVISEDIWQYG